MRHIDVKLEEFVWLASQAKWGIQKISIHAWLCVQFKSFVRIGDQMVRCCRG